jgi:hypothetical protein
MSWDSDVRAGKNKAHSGSYVPAGVKDHLAFIYGQSTVWDEEWRRRQASQQEIKNRQDEAAKRASADAARLESVKAKKIETRDDKNKKKDGENFALGLIGLAAFIFIIGNVSPSKPSSNSAGMPIENSVSEESISETSPNETHVYDLHPVNVASAVQANDTPAAAYTQETAIDNNGFVGNALITTRVTALNLRSTPHADDSSNVIAAMKRGSLVRMVRDSEDGWCEVEFQTDGQQLLRGYANSAFITALFPTQTCVVVTPQTASREFRGLY